LGNSLSPSGIIQLRYPPLCYPCLPLAYKEFLMKISKKGGGMGLGEYGRSFVEKGTGREGREIDRYIGWK
jgi:hypothetical protein